MAHQITLADEDYATLEAASARTGVPVEELVRRAIAECFATPSQPTQTGAYSFPSGTSLTRDELAAMEQLAQEIGGEKPWASDMVIEDRGPR